MIFLDTSALVCLYVVEPGTPALLQHLGPDRRLAVCDLAWVELHSAFARRAREGRLAERPRQSVLSRFRADWPRYASLPLDMDLLRRAALLVERRALRSLDAIHLAAALGLALELRSPLPFASLDQRLCRAAAAEGLPLLLPPS